MKIIIYETTHFETLSALVTLCDTVFESVTIFLTQRSFEQFQPIVAAIRLTQPVHFEVQMANEPNRAYIKRFFRYVQIQNFSHVHINTLDHNQLYFTYWLMKLKPTHISMTIHSINGYKTFRFNNLKNCTESIAKLFLYQKVDYYRVLGPAMKAYFETFFNKKKVVYIPGNFFDDKPEPRIRSNTDYFSIMVPGTVEAKRRDYQLVIRFFKKYRDKLSSIKPIKLILAGNANSAYGKQILSRLKQLNNDVFVVNGYNTDIETNEYTSLFCCSSIVWNPILVETRSLENVVEQSSISHSPGFLIDQVHYGRPGIIPAAIQVHEKLKDCNFYYENEDDLLKIFLEILTNDQLLKAKRKQILTACQYFIPANFQSAFEKLIYPAVS